MGERLRLRQRGRQKQADADQSTATSSFDSSGLHVHGVCLAAASFNGGRGFVSGNEIRG